MVASSWERIARLISHMTSPFRYLQTISCTLFHHLIVCWSCSLGFTPFITVILVVLSVFSVTRCPEFDAWIDMYGGDEFEKEVKDYIAMVNVACQSASPESLEVMKRHFIMSCKLEHMFWDQASERMTWPDILGTGSSGGGTP
jgi:TENA/THI-4/PQQC family